MTRAADFWHGPAVFVEPRCWPREIATINQSMRTRTCFLLLALLFGMASSRSLAADEPKSNEQRVREYVTAANKREVEKMLSMVTDDIQWLSVAGDKISIETQGKIKLRESMAAYFKSTPSARS